MGVQMVMNGELQGWGEWEEKPEEASLSGLGWRTAGFSFGTAVVLDLC